MPRKPPYRPTRGPRRRGPKVTREMRDKAVAKVRYVKPTRQRIRGAPVDLNIPVQWTSTPTPPDAIEGEVYSYDLRQNLNTSFGVVITLDSGVLPPGITIDGFFLSGVPTESGAASNIQLLATNALGSDVSAPFSFTIGVFEWTTTPTPPSGNTGVPYDYDMGVHLSSTENVTLITDVGALPAGLMYIGTRIFGTPTTIESQTGIETKADNGTVSAGSAPYAIDIAFGTVQWISTPAPLDPVVGEAYSYDLAQHLNGTDNVTIDVFSGALPPGLSINNTTYVIEGTPTNAGSYNNIRLRATSPFNNDISGFFNMNVLAAPPLAPVWTTDPPILPAGEVGQPYSYDFTPDLNTTEGVTVIETGTGSLPDGVSFTGPLTLGGTPTSDGTFDNLNFTATNVSGTTESAATQIVVAPATPVWQTQPNAPDATVNVAYPGYDLGALLNTTVGVSITIQSGALPTGLSINPSTLVIEGTPTVIQNQTGIVYRATNASGSADSNADSIRIFPAVPNWDTQPAPQSGQVGEVYTPYDLAQHLNTTDLVVITDNGNLPPGLSINNSTYVIEGTPTVDGTFTNIVLTATNTAGNDATLPFGISISPPAATIAVRLDNPVQGGKQVLDAGTETIVSPPPPPPPPPGPEADFFGRRTEWVGFSVEFYEDFSTDYSVDAYRWQGGIGNDPQNLSAFPNGCVRDTSDYVSGGGSLILTRPAGSGEPPGWYRPTAAHSRVDKTDPAKDGTSTVYPWSPTQGGNETATASSQGNYGPASTGTWEGDHFFIQLQQKFDPRRLAAAFNGGKISYITRVEQSLTAQEVVTTYDAFNPPNFAMYRQGSPAIISEIPLVPHIGDEWALYEMEFFAGDEVEGGSDTGSNTIVNVRRQRWAIGEKAFTPIFQKFELGIDYQNIYNKAWNALLLSIYHNASNIATEFWQKYDEVIFSTKRLRPKSTFTGSAMQTAADGLSAGQYALEPLAQNPASAAYDISWQNSEAYWDDERRELQYMGKAQGGGPARHFIYDEQTNAYRQTSGNVAPGKAGHIWGTTFDYTTGDFYFIEQNPEPDAERSLRVMRRDVENGQGSTNSPWTLLPEAGFDLWSPGQANIYQPCVELHPNLLGPGRKGIYGVAINQHVYFDFENQTWVKNNVPNAAPYNNMNGGAAVYCPGTDEIFIGDGTSTYVNDIIIKADDVNNAAPETAGPSPVRPYQTNQDHGKPIVDPRDARRLLLLEAGGDRVWSSLNTGRTWTLESFTHPFWTEGRANGLLGDDRGGWSPVTIPRYGVVLAVMQEVGPTDMHTMMWRPG